MEAADRAAAIGKENELIQHHTKLTLPGPYASWDSCLLTCTNDPEQISRGGQVH